MSASTVHVGGEPPATTPEPKLPRIIRRTRSPSQSSTLPDKSAAELQAKNRNEMEQALLSYTCGEQHAGNILASQAKKYGIPSELRRSIWPILLETHPIVQTCRDAPHTAPALQKAECAKDLPLLKLRKEIAKTHRRRKGIHPTIYLPSATGSPSNESVTSDSTATTNTSVATPLDSDPLDQLSNDYAVEQAIVSYLEAHAGIRYSHGMVHVCMTLSDWILPPPDESGASLKDQKLEGLVLQKAFDNIMTIMHWTSSSDAPADRHVDVRENDVLTRRISHFLHALADTMPELNDYLDEEGVIDCSEEWMQGWMQWWFAKELPKDQKARLWDFYLGYRPSPKAKSETSSSLSSSGTAESPLSPRIDLGDGDGQEEAPPRPRLPGNVNSGDNESYTPADWQPFICMAVLKAGKDQLEELELSEIRDYLSYLPKQNMNAIIKEAGNLRRELQELWLERETALASRYH